MEPPMYPRNRQFENIGSNIGAHLQQPSNWTNSSLDISSPYHQNARQSRSDSGFDFDFIGTPKQLQQQQYTPHPNVALYVASADSPWVPPPQNAAQPTVYFNEHQSTCSPGPESCRSYHSAPYTHDSAYGSGGTTTQSPYINEFHLDGQSGLEIDGKKPVPQASKLTSPKRYSRPKQVSQISQEHIRYPCEWPGCNKVLQCRSAYGKHMRMHDKPFRCEIPGCPRTGGFTTKNDLGRHQKSIHFGGVDKASKSYRCTGKNCKHPSKVWPRLDNFKSHLEKMHQGEDAQAIIKSSLIAPVTSVSDNSSANGGISDSVNPLDLQTQFPSQFSASALPITPEIRINGNPSFRNQLTDSTRLSPTSASSYQQRGRPRHTNTSPNMRPHTPMPAIADPPSPLETLANISVSQATANDVGARSSDVSGVGKVNQGQNGLSGVEKAIDPAKLQEMFSFFNQLKPLLPVLNSIKNNPSSASSSAGSRQNSTSQQSTCETEDEASDAAIKLLKAFLQPPSSGMSEGGSPGASSSNEHADGDGQWLYCDKPDCKKRVRRPCEMKKHLKRHTKPYGCTFGRCHKRFGSKNDWKRHENSQHFQIELWKCQELLNSPNEPRRICGKPCYTEGRFFDHLMDDHKMTRDKANTRIEVSHVGRNNQTRFWCGFCVEVIKLKSESGVASWDERFTHIDDHFKSHCNVDSWIDDREHVPKGTIGRSSDRKSPKPTDTQNNTSTNSPMSAPSSYTSPLPPAPPPAPPMGLNKRYSDDMEGIEMPPPHRQRTNDPHIWTCCECELGVQLVAIYATCNNCPHRRCPNCDITSANAQLPTFRPASENGDSMTMEIAPGEE